MERRSRKVNRVPELVHVVEVLWILHEIAHELGNREALSCDDKPTRVANATEIFLCQTGLSRRKVNCEPKGLENHTTRSILPVD